MGCHKIIGAQDGKIHDYWRRSQPIPWVRIFKVPEFTHRAPSRWAGAWSATAARTLRAARRRRSTA
jgi:hypothetical protein